MAVPCDDDEAGRVVTNPQHVDQVSRHFLQQQAVRLGPGASSVKQGLAGWRDPGKTSGSL